MGQKVGTRSGTEEAAERPLKRITCEQRQRAIYHIPSRDEHWLLVVLGDPIPLAKTQHCARCKRSACFVQIDGAVPGRMLCRECFNGIAGNTRTLR